MCFIISRRGQYSKMLTATKNITVYKYGRATEKTFRPFFFPDFIYRINKAPRKVTLKPNDSNRIHKGYHSCKSDKECSGKFIIPKGAKYYYSGSYREYVSELLIYKGLK